MSFFHIILGFILFLTMGCNTNYDNEKGSVVLKKTDSKQIREKEKYNILKTVFSSEDFRHLKKYDQIIVVSEAENVVEKELSGKKEMISLIKFIEEKYNVKIPELLFIDLIDKNKEKSVLKAPIDVPKIKIIPQSLLDQIFKEGDWKRFYEVYPKSSGYIKFSEAGFNDDFNEALIYYSGWASSNGAGGGLFYLKKEADQWEVIFHYIAWVS